jgi:TPR repeat protein
MEVKRHGAPANVETEMRNLRDIYAADEYGRSDSTWMETEKEKTLRLNRETETWMEKASVGGDVIGMMKYGGSLAEGGAGTARDVEEARRLWEMAAAAGDAKARSLLVGIQCR